jgi:hypothetical protein
MISTRRPVPGGRWCGPGSVSQQKGMSRRRSRPTRCCPGMIGLLPSPYACAAFPLDVNEWLTEYKTSLV